MIFGTGNIKLEWLYNTEEKSITIEKNTYTQENKFSRVKKKNRRDARNGNRKVIFKGVKSNFEITVFKVNIAQWEDYYSKLKTPDNGFIKVYPHADVDYFYRCYTDKQDFELFEKRLDEGILVIDLKGSEYADSRSPEWILEQGIWNYNGVWTNNGLWRF